LEGSPMITLREFWNAILLERIPDDMRALLEKLG
jgi:hypothetical protein